MVCLLTWFLVPNLCYTLITAFKPPRCTIANIRKSTVSQPWQRSVPVTSQRQLIADSKDQSDLQSSGANTEDTESFPTWKKAAIAGAVSLQKLLKLLMHISTSAQDLDDKSYGNMR
jgi:hypothetical protein